MCVSGLPFGDQFRQNVVQIGFEMLSYLAEHNKKFGVLGKENWNCIGDCVGGVVGEKKYL